MTKVLKADHARRVTLEGVGPVLRPIDIDQSHTGFSVLRTLRIYSFLPPAVIHGHAEEDEVFIIILTGQVQLQVRSEHWSQSDRRFTLSAAQVHAPVCCAAYLPPHAEYTLTPLAAADVAYARALPPTARAPSVFSTTPHRDPSGRVRLFDEASHAAHLRVQLVRVDAGDCPADLIAAEGPVSAAETLIHVRTLAGQPATVCADGLPAAALESWDTVAVSANERPCIRVGAHSSALGLVVAAA